jgi:tetratricopeptide (TPR) repeat protein
MTAAAPADDSSSSGHTSNEVSGEVHGPVIQAYNIGSVTIEDDQPTIPMELPPAPREFVDRSAQLNAITTAVDRQSADSGATVVVLSGLGGVGKTAAGVRWACQARNRFPDGQFYVDLAAYRHRAGVSVSDILGSLLLASGVRRQRLPVESAARSAMWRSRTADSRVLLLLDNADMATEVRPLRPSSTNSLVLVTSRRRLTGLVVDGADLIEIPPLPNSDGEDLIDRIVRDGRPARERGALAALVDLCGGLPIALRVAAARLVQRRNSSIAKLVADLADEHQRLTRLSVEGEPGVANVFNVAYSTLQESVRTLYCCLGLHPGPEMGVPVLAHAMASSVSDTDDGLDVLSQANLIEDLANERYRLHDLVRLHSRDVAWSDLTESRRRALIRNIVEWYLDGAMVADRAVLGTTRWRLARRAVADRTGDVSPAEGMRWLETERLNLLAAVRVADGEGWLEIVWQMCEALWALYYSRKYYADWIESHQLGVRAAVAAGNLAAEARLRHQLARAYIELKQFAEAEAELDMAASAASRASTSQPAASVLESLGVLLREQGRYAEALDKFQGARRANDELGNKRGGALQRYHIGDVLVRHARPGEAIPVLTEALDTFGELNDELAKAKAGIVLGTALEATSRLDRARDVLLDAARVLADRDQPLKEVQAWERLGHVAYRQRDETLFGRAAKRLVELYDSLSDPSTERARRWLTGGIVAAEADLR